MRGSHTGNVELDGRRASFSRKGGSLRVPSELFAERADEKRFGYTILGAGCASLSLCYYLLQQGVESPILILDQKSNFTDDRTWCFWDVEPTPFSHLAIHRWNSWSLHAAGKNVVQVTGKHPYLCLTAADFYEYVLEHLAQHENVTLKLGEPAESYKEYGDETYVKTSRNTYIARHVFDGRGLPPGSTVFEEARKEATWVPQKFVGLRLRSEKPVFDPGTCTLMDFEVSQERGLRFVYVLPFSGQEALVENVYLSNAEVSAGEHRQEIRAYLSGRYGLQPDDYEIHGEERGYIPMTDYSFPRKMGQRTYSVGMLGGESRPSTGYTFLRIQRYCKSLARSVAAGEEAAKRISPRRYDLLDKIFLRFMQQYPERCPEVYARMFGGVHPDTLVRFLTEKSSLPDDLKLVLSMPKAPFLKTVARMVYSFYSSNTR